jgi:hypothetical protein
VTCRGLVGSLLTESLMTLERNFGSRGSRAGQREHHSHAWSFSPFRLSAGQNPRASHPPINGRANRFEVGDIVRVIS